MWYNIYKYIKTWSIIKYMRKTKIISTLGPSSETENVIKQMIIAGMDVARLNFSHGDYSEHKKKIDIVKKLREELNKHTAIMLDTKGPEVRLKNFIDGKVTVKENDIFTLCLYDVDGDNSKVSVTYYDLYKDIHVGTRILIDDGLIEMMVEQYNEREIICKVLNGGVISDKKSINIPGIQLSIPFLSERDMADIKYGIEQDIDFIAVSFTQTANNVKEIRQYLESLGNPNPRIIAKIENSVGVDNIDEILNEADGIMVARGDLGVEIPIENVPIIQKQLILKCYNAGKQVITATQMLESMTKQPRPTRAEVTDVANAIYDGTSAIMLSGETAAGLYPIDAVKTMAKIAERTENEIDYKTRFSLISNVQYSNVTNAISHATCTTAHDLKATAIITVTKSGQTARLISRYRPETPIIGCSPEVKTCRHMNMSWGVTPVLIDYMQNTDELLDHTVKKVYEHNLIDYGDLIVITAGIPLGISGTTNMLKVQLVGDILTTGTSIGDKSVCGNLCVCTNEKEALETCKEGDILVIPNASNKIVDILRKCSGIICERDGLDSYVAMVGQILKIPVIIGAVDATKILKSGTTVTIDINRGAVYNGDGKCNIS